MNITKVQLKGVEYNLLDKDAQSKIAELKQNTYTKSEVDELLNDIDDKIEGIDLTPYETIKGASDKYQPKGNYLTEHQSLENYYTKDEVDAAIEGIEGGDTTGLLSKEEAEELYQHKGEYLTKGELDVKFADYYNRKEVDEKIDAAERKIPDLTDYAKKEYVDSELIEFGKTIYTKEEVDEALSEKADKSELEEYAKKDELPTEYDDTALKNRVANLEAIDHSQFLKEHQDITGKVDKVAGKELSTNDYTNEDKAKVAATPNFWVGSQSEFDSLSQDNNTFYFITEE